MPKDDDFSDIPHERNEPRPDFSKQPVPRKKLPPSIQATLDDEEKLWEALYEGQYANPHRLCLHETERSALALGNPRTPTSVMLPMHHECAQYSSLRTAM